MSRHRMSPVDTAWLHMDRPLNRMIVQSVMWLDGPIDLDTVCAVLDERLIARFPRFSQRVVEAPGVAWWQDVDGFEVREHLHCTQLPAPGNKRQLESFVSGLAHRELPIDRPLWEIHVVSGYDGTGSALVARIHHCIADGIALARVMMSLADGGEGVGTDAGPGGLLGLLDGVTRLGAGAAHSLVHPSRLLGSARTVAADGRELAHIVGLPPDHDSALHREVGLYKNARWSDPLPLDTVHAAAHAKLVTVNDLVLGAISGALRDHLAGRDGVAQDVRAIIPINLRSPGQPLSRELGNRFGLGYLDLPVSCDDPDRRLHEIARRTRSMKVSAAGVASLELLAAVGSTPYSVEQSLVDLFADKGTLIVTNVVGPSEPVVLAGRRVLGTIGWPPESGNIALGMSVISYAGHLSVGLLADDHLLPAPDAFLDRVLADLHELMAPARTNGVR